MRRWALSILVAGATLGWLAVGASAPAIAQPHASSPTASDDPCTELARYPMRAGGRELVIPVSVQIMKPRGGRRVPDDVGEVFSEARIKRLFRPDAAVNAIWRQAKIRFALYRLRHCEYAREDFGLRPDDREEIPPPDAGETGAAFFRRVNERYNDRTLRGLDLYLWRDMRAWAGYGARHRPDRPGAVWLDRDCHRPGFAHGCGGLLAHEVGHFFGLCHSCTASWDPPAPVTCRVCVAEGKEPPACGPAKDFIMRSTYDGKRLTACEIAEATPRAQERALRAPHP